MTSRENDLFANLVPRAFPFEIEAGAWERGCLFAYMPIRYRQHSTIHAISYFLIGTICGPIWRSFPVRDHFRSNLGIICGPVQIQPVSQVAIKIAQSSPSRFLFSVFPFFALQKPQWKRTRRDSITTCLKTTTNTRSQLSTSLHLLQSCLTSSLFASSMW